MSSIEPLNWSLQQYWIGHLIASGHFGTVYQARHTPTGRDVALKLIPLQGPDSEEKVAAERHGAVLQQRFGAAHAGLVPEVFEHQTITPFYAISMERVQGRQLTTLIAEGPGGLVVAKGSPFKSRVVKSGATVPNCIGCDCAQSRAGPK